MIRFDLNPQEIADLQQELGATQDQLYFSMSRALARTAKTLQAQGAKALKAGLDARRQNTLRKRLKELKVRRRRKDFWTVGVWAGLNDLRVSDIKGTPKKTAEGATFRDVNYPGAFIAKSKSGKRTIFKRTGKGRLPIAEQTFPIADRAQIILEDEVVVDTTEIFMKHLRTDLRSRVSGFGMQTKDEAWAKRKRRR